MRAWLILFALLTPWNGWAAEALSEDRGAAAVWQSLKKLETNVRVLYVTAHPDDEDAGLLTYLARGRGYDVTLMPLTRGESGANLITGDTFDRLGVLRTLELSRAAANYGVALRFAGFADYGYSKNLDEAWRKWNRDDVVAEVVRAIHEIRPHIVITRFTGTQRDGHGQHQASGVVARLAFDAATAWKPMKLYIGAVPTEDWTIRVDTGVYEPMLGRSYAQIGREGYRWQRSQAMGAVIARPGPSLSYLRLAATRVGEAAREQDFSERIAEPVPDAVARHVAAAQQAFKAERPADCAPHLAAALQIAPAAMQPRLRNALNRALGLELEALVEPAVRPSGMAAQFRPFTTFRVAEPGRTFKVSGALHVRSGETLESQEITTALPSGWTAAPEDGNVFAIRVPESAPPWQVNWHRDSIQQSRYTVEPEASRMKVVANYRYRGAASFVEAEPETSSIDSIGLGVRKRLAVGPAISIAFAAPSTVLAAGGSGQARVECVIRKVTDGPAKGVVRLQLPAGVTAHPAEQSFDLVKEGDETRVAFRLMTPPASGTYRVEAVATVGGKQFRASFAPITYAGLETLYLSEPAVHQVAVIDVKIAPGLKAGYVMGSGDEVPEALRQLGVDVTMLSASDLATGDLSRFQVILLGIRAYAARPDVKTHNARLLEYVNNGGVLIVQYNTQEYDNNFGPYPYTMTQRAEEISEEDSPVSILEPAHPVFQTPNRITAADFSGWVEQRGSKFLTTWDGRYKALLETHDAGQPPQRGGWLEARHGKGLYIYCAYAWYRQLPYAVPGAYRIFANLVSLGAPNAPWR